MNIYEVGTYEKWEAGFQAFYRTLNKEKATEIYEIAKEVLSKIPNSELLCSDDDENVYINICNEIDLKFQRDTGIDIFLSIYSGGLYEIQLLSFKIDE